MVEYPILYSYRRCPYAMRARMAIASAGLQVEQREIVFWDKPKEMLMASPKGTVPVLILPDGQVIDESRDIMFWALQLSDPSQWMLDAEQQSTGSALMDVCDFEFKTHLDHYKYADRFPEYPQVHYRQQGEQFLAKLEAILAEAIAEKGTLALNGVRVSMLDIAIFPFVRQFANVDKVWFSTSEYQCLRQWLQAQLEADYFSEIMKNRPVWQGGHQPLWVLEPMLKTRDQFTKKALLDG